MMSSLGQRPSEAELLGMVKEVRPVPVFRRFGPTYEADVWSPLFEPTGRREQIWKHRLHCGSLVSLVLRLATTTGAASPSVLLLNRLLG